MDLLAQMATFVRVVDGQSLSAAARAQSLSLPAVSRQLRALEADLGTTLIVRSTRRLHVTDEGQRWYEHCKRVLRSVEEARESMRDGQAARGRLVVSASFTFGSVILVPCLSKISAAHPHLEIDLRLEDRLVDLVGEGVDVAIRAGSPPPDSTAYVAYPLMTMRRLLVAAPRWLRKHGSPRAPSELERHASLVQVTVGGAVIRWRLCREGQDLTVEAHGSLRSSAPIALRDLAVGGSGVAYLPCWLVEQDLAEGRLRRVLPGWSSPPITAWAVCRTELRGSPRLRAFLDAMPRPDPPTG